MTDSGLEAGSEKHLNAVEYVTSGLTHVRLGRKDFCIADLSENPFKMFQIMINARISD